MSAPSAVTSCVLSAVARTAVAVVVRSGMLFSMPSSVLEQNRAHIGRRALIGLLPRTEATAARFRHGIGDLEPGTQTVLAVLRPARRRATRDREVGDAAAVTLVDIRLPARSPAAADAGTMGRVGPERVDLIVVGAGACRRRRRYLQVRLARGSC